MLNIKLSALKWKPFVPCSSPCKNWNILFYQLELRADIGPFHLKRYGSLKKRATHVNLTHLNKVIEPCGIRLALALK
uniref:Uncharacterized protein n=1 Tax=Anguilla anguilla TaxID=7936 RepID=A0A0E9PSE7_ANGAN